MKRQILPFLSLLALWIEPLLGAENSNLPENLGQVKVQARYNPLDEKTASFYEVDLDQFRGESPSVADIMARLPSVSTRKRGGLGAFQDVVIRGLNGRQLQVFVDGVLISSQSGAVDFGKFSVDQLDRIEVYPSQVPASLGGSALGGAINLVTKTSTKKSGEFRASVGQFNTHKGHISWAAPLESLGKTVHQLSLSGEHSDNDYDYFDQNRTPYNLNDDYWRPFKNADYSSWSLNQTIKHHYAKGILKWQGYWNQNWGGLPSAKGHDTKSARFENKTGRLHASWKHCLMSSWAMMLETRLAYHREYSEYTWTPEDRLAHYFNDTARVANDLHRILPSVGLSFYPWESLKVGMYTRLGWERLIPYNLGDLDETWAWESMRTTLEPALSLQWEAPFNIMVDGTISAQLFKDNVDVGDADGDSNDEEIGGLDGKELAYQAAARWITQNALGTQAVFANWGEGFRLPGMDEKYGGRKGHIPNVELEGELSKRLEVGGRWGFKQYNLQTSYFFTRMDNRIYPYLSNHLVKSLNVDGYTRSQGWESSMEILWKYLRLRSNFTLRFSKLHAEGSSMYEGNQVPNDAKWDWYQYVGVPYKTLLLEYHFSWGKDIYRDLGNTRYIPNLFSHDAAISWKFIPNWKLKLSGNNLSDEFFEHAYDSHPYPGRNFSVSIQGKF